jgi:redox-sensitive bicupin YhaK (pirin superfamily)
MPVKIYPKEVQHKGGFNNGEIIENKPIQLSGDSKLQPYSNIFYWAHAYSEKGSTIGEHPHNVFEILSFVIEGSIEHYDSKNLKWIPLKKGDVQIIRAGNGISHSEKLGPDAYMFQIWFDPDIRKTINVPASYNDYSSDAFPVKATDGMKTKYYTGEGSPLEMTTQGTDIFEIEMAQGIHILNAKHDKVYSVYVIFGEAKIEGKKIRKDDFFVIDNDKEIKIEAEAKARIFVIGSPQNVPYETYAKRYI